MPLHTTDDPAERAAHIAERETRDDWFDYYEKWLSIYRDTLIEFQKPEYEREKHNTGASDE